MTKLLLHPTKYLVSVILYILIVSCSAFLIFHDYIKLSGYLISILLIILPYYLYTKSPKLKLVIKKNLVEVIQFVIALSCFFNLLGSLNFYNNPSTWWYDLAIHFISPIMVFSLTPLFVIIFQKQFLRKIYLPITLIGNFVLIILLSFSWEFIESSVDNLFISASMFGQLGEIYYDTLADLAADFTGGLVATWLIYKYFYDYMLDNTIRHKDNAS